MRIYILAAVAAAGIGLGGTFGASAVPISGNLVGASAPAPELHKVYYHRHARDEPTVATLATTVETTVAITVATSRVWTAISISPDLTVSKLLKSETYRYPGDT